MRDMDFRIKRLYMRPDFSQGIPSHHLKKSWKPASFSAIAASASQHDIRDIISPSKAERNEVIHGSIPKAEKNFRREICRPQ